MYRKNNAEAVKWYQKAVEQGDPWAQNNLGLMYSKGRGGSKLSQAVKLYRMAAEQGHVEAQNNLGLMYSKGRGVQQDFAEAVKWFRKALSKASTKHSTT